MQMGTLYPVIPSAPPQPSAPPAPTIVPAPVAAAPAASTAMGGQGLFLLGGQNGGWNLAGLSGLLNMAGTPNQSKFVLPK